MSDAARGTGAALDSTNFYARLPVLTGFRLGGGGFDPSGVRVLPLWQDAEPEIYRGEPAVHDKIKSGVFFG